MWVCKLCKVKFLTESIEPHIYTNHLSYSGSQKSVGSENRKQPEYKVYACGQCSFNATGFQEIAEHCLNEGHDPGRLMKGQNYEDYSAQLLTVLRTVATFDENQDQTTMTAAAAATTTAAGKNNKKNKKKRKRCRNDDIYVDENGGKRSTTESVIVDIDLSPSSAKGPSTKAQKHYYPPARRENTSSSCSQSQTTTKQQFSVLLNNNNEDNDIQFIDDDPAEEENEEWTAKSNDNNNNLILRTASRQTPSPHQSSRTFIYEESLQVSPIADNDNSETLTSSTISSYARTVGLIPTDDSSVLIEPVVFETSPTTNVGQSFHHYQQRSRQSTTVSVSSILDDSDDFDGELVKSIAGLSSIHPLTTPSTIEESSTVRDNSSKPIYLTPTKDRLSSSKKKQQGQSKSPSAVQSATPLAASEQEATLGKNKKATTSMTAAQETAADPSALKNTVSTEDQHVAGGSEAAKNGTEETEVENSGTAQLIEPLKPYKCSMCSMSFASAWNARSHEATHNNNNGGAGDGKELKCQHCQRMFSRRHHLQRHEASHKGVACNKPYTCSICGKGLAQKWHLIEHERRHTRRKPFPCPDCDRDFWTPETLSRHRKSAGHLPPPTTLPGSTAASAANTTEIDAAGPSPASITAATTNIGPGHATAVGQALENEMIAAAKNAVENNSSTANSAAETSSAGVSDANQEQPQAQNPREGNHQQETSASIIMNAEKGEENEERTTTENAEKATTTERNPTSRIQILHPANVHIGTDKAADKDGTDPIDSGKHDETAVGKVVTKTAAAASNDKRLNETC